MTSLPDDAEDIDDLTDPVEQRSQLSEILSNPFQAAQGFIEYCLAWVFTRHWYALLGYLPVLLILSTLGGLAVYGWSIDNETLVQRYAQWSDAELGDKVAPGTTPVAELPTDELMKVEGVSPFGELLLRRVLQLEKSDTRSRYLVALQIASRGRRGQARQLMRQLAPERSSGFAPAHAWLAIDQILQGPIDNNAKISLINDLEVAVTWQGTGAKLREVFANLLESEGRIGEAIKVLQATSETDASVLVRLVEVAKKHGRKQPATDASSKAKLIFSRKINDQSATVMDYISLARLWVIEQNPDEAINQTAMGLRKYPDDANLKRVLSECFRVKYLAAVRERPSNSQANMVYLDEALKADPSNPAVSEEVAKLMAEGGEVSPSLKFALEQQLADGKSTTMTHLMLATQWLKKGDLAKAIPHLEVANRKSPNAPVILNNLALAMARVSPENLPMAKELIDRGLKFSGPHAELFDSQGEIRMAAGDFVGAVESLEASIGLDGNRLSTRKRLIEAYEKAGLKDLIPVQIKKIRDLESAKTPKSG